MDFIRLNLMRSAPIKLHKKLSIRYGCIKPIVRIRGEQNINVTFDKKLKVCKTVFFFCSFVILAFQYDDSLLDKKVF